jgi:CRP-like cAMP-binding protein
VTGSHGFWFRIGPSDRAAIEQSGVRRKFPPGAFLWRQGDQSAHVAVIEAGTVKITKPAPDGRDIIIAVRGPGDVVGEMAAITQDIRSAAVRAVDAVTVLSVAGPTFAALCRTEPRISWVLLQITVDRLREAMRHWAEFGGGTAPQRIIALLVELAVRDGTPAPGGLAVPISNQGELAATAAASRESMSRVLAELRRDGVISTDRRLIVVHDLDELRRRAP